MTKNRSFRGAVSLPVVRLGIAATCVGVLVASFGRCGEPQPRTATQDGSSTHQPEAGEPPAPADARPDAEAPADTDPHLLIRRIYDYGMDFGQTLAAIRETMGPPTSAETTRAPNRHVRGAMDSLFLLRYPGLTFELNRPGPVKEDLLTSVSLSAPDHELPGGLQVGLTSGEELRRRLGSPDRTRSRADTTVLSHQVPGQAADRLVEFAVAGDTLRRVNWVPYVD